LQAYATARILAKNKLTLKDISVIEFHEAFAAQVLANLRALESHKFCTETIGVAGAGAHFSVGLWLRVRACVSVRAV
jgi:acetyl-CoA acetyltransferase